MKDQILVIVMGVSGTGKSSTGFALAQKRDWIFIEADDYHSTQAKERMASGKPLDDKMRAPWIDRICESLVAHREKGNSVVLACSALTTALRNKLRATAYPQCLFLLLNANKEIIARRMMLRKGHFMPSSLLDSQFEALEWPTHEDDVVEIDVDKPLEEIIEQAESLVNGL